MADDELRILLDRRRFLGMSGTGLAALLLASCGGGEDDGGGEQVKAPTVAKAPTKLEGALNIYTWADYQNPDNTKNFSKANNNLKVKIDVFDSNEDAIAKLSLSGRKVGYDIVVPTGTFIPQMVAKKLLREIDKTKLPNFAKLDPKLLNQSWDPGNKHSVVKDWGSTGYVYDKTLVTEQLTDWAGYFRAAAMKGVSGKVSALDTPGDVTGMAFWREGIDWNTTNPADMAKAEQILLTELVPHIKAFDSFPREGLLNGDFALSQMFNGDARQVLREDPDRFAWVLGAPKTELWVDNWCILASAEHPEAAHAFINNILDPKVSAAEIDHHGYNTAVTAAEQFLPKDLNLKELIFFTDEQKARFVPGSLANQDLVTKTYNKVKAAASK